MGAPDRTSETAETLIRTPLLGSDHSVRGSDRTAHDQCCVDISDRPIYLLGARVYYHTMRRAWCLAEKNRPQRRPELQRAGQGLPQEPGARGRNQKKQQRQQRWLPARADASGQL